MGSKKDFGHKFVQENSKISKEDFTLTQASYYAYLMFL